MAHLYCLPALAPLFVLAASSAIACNVQDPAPDISAASASTAEGTAPDTTGTLVPTTGPGDSGDGTGSSGGPTSTTDPPATSGGAACGDGQIDADEVCDGAALGGEQCADVEPGAAGVLTCADDCAAFDASECVVPPGAALVVLNEVTSKGAAEGPFSGKGDAIEVRNAGGMTADLSGWQLSDDPLFPFDKTYVFPPGTELAPGEFLVLVELDMLMAEGELPFGISSTDEEILTLADADAATIDQLIVAGVDALVSYCRLPDGTGAWQRCDQTLGFPNLAASKTCGNDALEDGEVCDGAELGGQTCADVGYAAGTLACTPLCALDTAMCQSDSAIVVNELEATNDRIELHNAGMQAVDLAGWILTDAVIDADYDPGADLKKLVFPAQTSLAAKQHLIVTKGPNPGQHPFGLSGEGDSVTLMKPDLTPVSHVSYADGEATVSYCRLPDGPTGTWTAGCMPSFGLANKAP
jgi:hypothetical protein